MDTKAPRDLFACFRQLEDPRMERTRLHRLDDILAISVMAVLAGAEGPTDRPRSPRLVQVHAASAPRHSQPRHPRRVLAALDPDAFERCLIQWIQGLIHVSGQQALHIDGKTLRRSFDAASQSAAIHMVSVWASKAELALVQLSTEASGAKSNEITTIPKLLELLTLHGAVVTIDAIGCQRDIARQILKGQGDYLLALKDNQPSLHEDVKLLFDEAIERGFEGMGYDVHEQTEKGHGRIESRKVWVAVVRGTVPIRAWRQYRDSTLSEAVQLIRHQRCTSHAATSATYRAGQLRPQQPEHGARVRAVVPALSPVDDVHDSGVLPHPGAPPVGIEPVLN